MLQELSQTELVFIQHDSNPDIIAVQYSKYQGLAYPFVVFYSYKQYDGVYAYNQNASTSIRSSELFPLTERYLDHLVVPAPSKALTFLKD